MYKIAFTILIFSLAVVTEAQKSNIGNLWTNPVEHADYLFENRLYSEALTEYLDLIDTSAVAMESSPTRQLIIGRKIAHCYYKLRKPIEAQQFFEFTIERTLKKIHEDSDLLLYAETLLTNGNNERAKYWFNQYYDLTRDELGKERFAGVMMWDELNGSTKPTALQNISLNSPLSELAAVPTPQGLVFSTQQTASGFADHEYLMGEMESYALYLAPDSTQIRKIRIGNRLFNVTSPAFLPNGQVIVSASKNSIGKGADLLLFSGKITASGRWTDFRPLPIHEPGSSILSPFISERGDTLFFASNRPGGQGGFDLYYSLYSKGTWAPPVNLGPKVNTSRNELYPFSYHGILYFSSDGQPGLGGLDLFSFDGSIVENMASPLNSPYDDFALAYLSETEGYFTSNRPEGQGKDDIYHFIQTDNPEVLLHLSVHRLWDSTRVSGAAVTLTALNGTQTLTGMTHAAGTLTTTVRTRTGYRLTIQKDGLTTHTDTVRVALEDLALSCPMDEIFTYKAFVFSAETNEALAQPIIFVQNLRTGQKSEVQGNGAGYFEIRQPTHTRTALLLTREGYAFAFDTLHFNQHEFTGTYSLDKIRPAGSFTLKDLLYELDQHQLKDDFVPVLDSIAANLRHFTNMRIEVISHTDSRGSAAYNLELSQLRAESVMNYLISKGVAPSRIRSIGRGEQELLNHCSDGIRCTDEQHGLNRRTEIKLYKTE